MNNNEQLLAFNRDGTGISRWVINRIKILLTVGANGSSTAALLFLLLLSFDASAINGRTTQDAVQL